MRREGVAKTKASGQWQIKLNNCCMNVDRVQRVDRQIAGIEREREVEGGELDICWTTGKLLTSLGNNNNNIEAMPGNTTRLQFNQLNVPRMVSIKIRV